MNDEAFQKTVRMFEAYAKSKKLTPYGPLIVRSRTEYAASGLIQRTTVMIQLREEHSEPDAPYGFEKLLRREGCLLARYRGPPAGLAAAYSKIQVHAFENDIRLNGETYTVFVEQNADGLLADVFAETVI
jgi:hypothetical protein